MVRDLHLSFGSVFSPGLKSLMPGKVRLLLDFDQLRNIHQSLNPYLKELYLSCFESPVILHTDLQ